MNRTAAIVIAVIVFLGLFGLLYWYVLPKNNYYNTTSNTTSTVTVTTIPSPTTQSSSAASSSTSSTATIDVTGQSFSFSPKQIKVSKGTKVTINFTAKDVSHTFTLPDFNVDTGLVTPGTSKTVQFTADKTGTFEFYCTPHKSMGMTGTLTVQ